MFSALLSHPSSAFCLVVPEPSSAEMSTLRRIYAPIQTYRIDIREDANSHKVSESTFQVVFARLSVGLPRLASCL